MNLDQAPFVRRFWAYLAERFPPAAYGLLVALFFGSAALVARDTGGGTSIFWPGAVVVLGVFFHLRVFDEHKDHDADVAAYPDRVLSRGWVTLKQLRGAAAVALVVQLGLSLWAGPRALAVWGATVVFTLLMLKEFFVGAWLERRMVLYAITHNPVVAGLALFGWACTDAAWDWRFAWYVGAASLGSLAFEIGRKMRLPDEEVAGVPSYTSVLGRGRALALLWTVSLGTGLCLVGVLRSASGRLAQGWNAALPDLLGLDALGAVALAVVALLPIGLARSGSKAKMVEGGATGVLFVTLLLAGVFAWP